MVERGQARIIVQVKPNASQSEVLRIKDGVLYIRIAAPPIKGKANQELIKLLSHTFGVSKSCLTIERGVTDRRKIIAISGLSQDQVMEQLERQGTLEAKDKNYDRHSRPPGYGTV